MPLARKCPKCGAELIGEALDGLCPNCVGALVLATEPVDAETLPVSLSLTEKPGDRIGHYKLLQQIGEGGCGVVYMAQQEEPIRRQVALKIIKLGMDTRRVIGRFEAERQALALMDHPNIAKVFDAGATDTGRPYFVMELVRGIKITDYCDVNQVPTRERLNLFVQVCQAIQHAHQKGLIHRDIKPSNILVTLRDGVPVPKVIDFGIAKATTDQLLTDNTVFTEFQQFLGTPAYMSPEQAEMSELGVDTRSDIYSLGILLYELLTGKTPFESKDLVRAGLDEIRRLIREKEPARPSTRLSTMLEGELTTAAKHRHTEAPKLIHLLRGDLDWIVMKALEKDRARRYETANGLAMDIERHMNNEPVIARPPSTGYRFQKLARRHKLAFTAVAAISTVLVLGVVVSTWEAIRARRAESEQSRLLQQAEQAGNTAKRQEQLARESADEARRQQRLASDQELLARRRFYAAQMNLANQAVEAGQLGRALALLETQRPKAAPEDLRTFEWYHLWGLCNARLRITLRGHKEPVYSVAISPDGKTLASASSDGTIRLWDTSTGREGLTLKLPRGNAAFAVAFTPDGRTVAAGSSDGLVRLWETANGKLRATLPGAHGWVRTLAISPNGGYLACGGDDGLIKLFDLPTGTEQTMLSHEGCLMGIAFSKDGEKLASKSFESVKSWDLAHGQIQLKWQVTVGGWALALSPDGKMLATAPHEIQVWDTTTGQLHAALKGHSPPIQSLVYLPDGKALASCASDRTIRLWPMPATNSVVTENQIIGEHLDSVLCLGISADGTTLASGANDGSVKLWNVEQTPEQAKVQVVSHFQMGIGSTNGSLSSLLFSPDGNRLIGVMEHTTAVKNIASGTDYLVLPGATGRGALSPDGKLLATGDTAGTVKLWDPASGRLLATTQAHTSAVVLAFSPDGRMIVTCGFSEQDLKAWDPAAALNPLWRTAAKPASAGISALAFSPDGKTIAAMLRHARVDFFDASTGRQTEGFRVERGFAEVWALAFSPDGRFLATGSETGAAKLWNVETGQLHAALQGHTGTIRAVAFSPDGVTIATGSDDQTVRLWDVATGQERLTLKGFQSWVTAVTFSPDGNTLAAGSFDRMAHVWRASRAAEATANAQPPESLLRDARPFVANSLQTLANVLREQGQLPEAEAKYHEGLALQRKLSSSGDLNLAYSLKLVVDILCDQAKWSEAEAPCREAVALFKQSAQDNPEHSGNAIDLGHIQWRLADVLTKTGRRDQAEQILREALHVFEQATRDFPADPFLRQEQACSRRSLADMLHKLGRFDEAEREARAAIALYAEIKTGAPTNDFYSLEEAYTSWMRADILAGAGKLEAAEAEYRNAIALHEKARADFPNQAMFPERLSTLKAILVELLRRRGKLAEGKSMYPNSGIGERFEPERTDLVPGNKP